MKIKTTLRRKNTVTPQESGFFCCFLLPLTRLILIVLRDASTNFICICSLMYFLYEREKNYMIIKSNFDVFFSPKCGILFVISEVPYIPNSREEYMLHDCLECTARVTRASNRRLRASFITNILSFAYHEYIEVRLSRIY